MVSIVLYNPLIPPNTGNIMRLCSNIGFELHLIKPLGFSLNEKSLKRARLDYFSNIKPILYDSIEQCVEKLGKENFIAISKFGKKKYIKANYTRNSVLLFGSEISGLPYHVKNMLENNLFSIPMKKGSRSLNLSNAVAVVAYEAWRNLEFCSLE